MLKAALAHLWFVTIHPFDDGNGRIARAIADLALARSEQSPKRFYSMSAQIRLERNDYYDILERTQKGTLDVTPWMQWFLGCLDRAFDGAEAHAGERATESPVLGNPRRRVVQRPPAEGRQSVARRVRGQAHLIEMGKPGKMLSGHGQPRYQRPGQTRDSDKGCGRRPEHELFADMTQVRGPVS